LLIACQRGKGQGDRKSLTAPALLAFSGPGGFYPGWNPPERLYSGILQLYIFCGPSRISRAQLAGGIFGDDAGKTTKGSGAEGLQLFKRLGGCAADFLKALTCKPCGSKTGLIVKLACAADEMSKSASAMFNFRSCS
jgi:hypothetical protein